MLLHNYRFVWDNFDRADWENLFRLAGQTNLLQSWAYGEAKARVEGWVVRRGLIYKNNATIAILQVLEKTWPVLGGVARINRGPLWVAEQTPGDMEAVYALIRREWSLRKRRILLIAPELPNTPENVALLSSLGYRSRRKNAWHSAWLDLSKTEEELRKRLKSNWRNKLNYGERLGFRFEVSYSEEDFWWLMERYRELKEEKNFRGIGEASLDSLRKQSLKKDHVLVMKAVLDGKQVAGVIIARHGVASTYLVGWNGAEGRQLKANNFLLWNAMLEMKRIGCIWFDLGGIDDIYTPWISEFKKGLGGEEYILTGEYLCI